jgi:hypothetical protein
VAQCDSIAYHLLLALPGAATFSIRLTTPSDYCRHSWWAVNQAPHSTASPPACKLVPLLCHHLLLLQHLVWPQLAVTL